MGDSRHFDLQWVMATDVDHDKIQPDQITNHFDCCRGLTTKIGLTCSLRQSIFYTGVGAEEYYPRAFDLYDPLDRAEFVLNFKHSKAESILRAFLRDVDAGEAERTFSQDVVAIASKVCMRMVTDPEEVMDCASMAEDLGTVPAAEWEVLQQVNLDDPNTKLEGGISEDVLDQMINKRSTRVAPKKAEEEKDAK